MRLRAVPYYYLHLFNDIGPVHDEEGHEYPDLAAARQAALRNIRSILAEEVLKGRLDLNGRIVIADAAQSICATVPFVEAVAISHSGVDE